MTVGQSRPLGGTKWAAKMRSIGSCSIGAKVAVVMGTPSSESKISEIFGSAVDRLGFLHSLAVQGNRSKSGAELAAISESLKNIDMLEALELLRVALCWDPVGAKSENLLRVWFDFEKDPIADFATKFDLKVEVENWQKWVGQALPVHDQLILYAVFAATSGKSERKETLVVWTRQALKRLKAKETSLHHFEELLK
jgi:hypothetical protein